MVGQDLVDFPGFIVQAHAEHQTQLFVACPLAEEENFLHAAQTAVALSLHLCGGIGKNNIGLTSLGRRALRLMQQAGIILDVSHMSDQSFWEALEEYTLPPIASHSNSRKICANMRNLTDKQFVYLVKRGGLCGINYCPVFLCDEKSGLDLVVKHIEHFLSLGGENSICLGSDFDGIEKTAQNLENAGCVYKLFDKHLSINYNESLVNKIAVVNFHNFLQKFETLS